MPKPNLNSFIQLALKYKKIILIVVTFSLIILASIIISQYQKPQESPGRNNYPPVSITQAPTITAFIPQQVFTITKTTPTDGAYNVSPGEIGISFTTNVPVVSEKSFTMEIKPALPFYWKFENKYPTREIKTTVYGGLKTNTKYTVTVYNTKKQTVHAWNFTTASKPAESSSGYVYEDEKKNN